MTDKIDIQVHVTNKAHGKMRSHTTTEIYVRDFDVVLSDEPPQRGGTNTAPTIPFASKFALRQMKTINGWNVWQIW